MVRDIVLARMVFIRTPRRALIMITVFILRRTMRDARRSQAALEATPDLLVAGVVDTLAGARMLLESCDPDVLLADLRLEDGNLLALLNQMRATAPASDRPQVLTVATASDDPMLFGALRSGAQSYLLDIDANAAPAPAIRRLLRGEASASAGIARQVLTFFGVPMTAASAPAVNKRALDWLSDAQNPLRLSSAEGHMLALLSQGHGVGQIAVRMSVSVESIGRRIANVYRKIQWDVRSGSLSLQAA
jgi:DNA-binding NarL/FixJ family response regulator